MYAVKWVRLHASDRMVDPTSDLNEDVPEEEAPRCAVCDEPLVENPDHRVVTRVEDGTVVTTHFCNESCRAEWSE
jgi:uncharacterized protein with PIN domain